MTFLSGLLAAFVKPVLDWFLEKFTLLAKWTFEKIDKAIELSKRRKEIKEKSEKSVEPLKKAKTAEEIDDAFDDAFRDF